MNKQITIGSVFSGIGGELVAASMLGWEVKFFCEKNPFGRKVLDYWFPNSKSYEDITNTDFTEWRGKVDVLTGGFPCQPFSYAGKRRGADDDRYLWPHMFRCIDQIRPTWVVAENVAGILTMVEQGEVSKVASPASLFAEINDVRGQYQLRETFTLQRICTDLEGHGYAVQPILIPACAVGAPHRRDRVFIVARRKEAVSEDSMHGGQLHRPNEEQGSERNERNTCAGGGERLRGEISRTVATDSACSGEGTPRKSDCAEGSGCRPNQQPSERRAASEWSDRFYAILRHAADTEGEPSERLRPRQSEVGRAQQEQSGGRGGKGSSERPTPHPDSHRGCEVDEHMESELADGAKPVSNGRQWNVADTSHEGLGRAVHQGDWREIQLESLQRGRISDSASGEVAGCGRWQNFPSVSPVHRGNDGLPFDVDRLTLSFGKWRTEAIKAYGNAIVPQVMYEIFRAIEIVENKHTENTLN